MMRSTVPRVSFTTSHMALMLRSSAPLLGGHDMHSNERFKHAWDEIPLCTCFMDRAEWFAWDWRCRYELGLRDTMRSNKMFYGMNLFMFALIPIMWYGLAWPFFWYYNVHQELPPWVNRENGPANSKRFGREVYCADGKFVTPHHHINPPMFTMTVEELAMLE